MSTAISAYHWFEKLVPQTAVSASFYTPGEDQYADRQVVDAALAWLLSTVFLYVLLFNLRYAVLNRRTYSLSFVDGADEIILYSALPAGMALLVPWGVYAFALRLFRLPRPLAALHSLDLILGILYLLALPVLWNYALNSIFITWTLPYFPSTFLAFLSLIQILLLAPLGLLLTALTAVFPRSPSH